MGAEVAGENVGKGAAKEAARNRGVRLTFWHGTMMPWRCVGVETMGPVTLFVYVGWSWLVVGVDELGVRERQLCERLHATYAESDDGFGCTSGGPDPHADRRFNCLLWDSSARPEGPSRMRPNGRT